MNVRVIINDKAVFTTLAQLKEFTSKITGPFQAKVTLEVSTTGMQDSRTKFCTSGNQILDFVRTVLEDIAAGMG